MQTNNWLKPKTTKLYIHPMMSERIITVWPDFKVINGEIKETTPLNGAKGHGFMILYSDSMKHIPWMETRFNLREDGIPIHSMEYKGNNFTISMESFCCMDRNPKVFCRLALRNDNLWAVKDSISIMPRSGNETYMMGTSVDAYLSYEPCIESWKMLPSNWGFNGKMLGDGESSIALKCNSDLKYDWIEKEVGELFLLSKLLKINFELAAEEEVFIDIAFYNGKDNDMEVQYDDEKTKTIDSWKKILGKITVFPASDLPSFRKMFNHLVVQSLQMFAIFEGKEYVIPRQGAIVHWIWPWEAVELMTALDRIGLHEYTEKIYEFFFKNLQVKEGKDKGKINTIGIDWACYTGSVIWGLSKHIGIMDNREVFDYYRQMLMDCYWWIEQKRFESSDGSSKEAKKGIFPPMRMSDWPDEYQSWCFTDLNNLMGYKEMADLFYKFGDKDAVIIEESYNSYRSILKDILDVFVKEYENNEEILIPNKLGIEFTDPALFPYHAEASNLIRAGFIKPGDKVFKQLEMYFRNRGLMKNGLTGLMQDSYPGDRWCGHTWYLGVSDMVWFYSWLETGELTKAEEAFFALKKYGMTEEYYMLERYADNDPTYVPWSPNASNNGRFIKMMLDYCDYVKNNV